MNPPATESMMRTLWRHMFVGVVITILGLVAAGVGYSIRSFSLFAIAFVMMSAGIGAIVFSLYRLSLLPYHDKPE